MGNIAVEQLVTHVDHKHAPVAIDQRATLDRGVRRKRAGTHKMSLVRTTPAVILMMLAFVAFMSVQEKLAADSPAPQQPSVAPPATAPAQPDPKLASEQGEAIIRFVPKKGQARSAHVTFKHEYRRKPLVLVSDNGSYARFLVIKAERVTPSGCELTARMLEKDDQSFDAHVAYVVIGEPADEARAVPRDRLPSEFGTIGLDFEENKDVGTVKLQFRERYRHPPVVLVSECDSSGTFVVVKSERITEAGCDITGRMIDHWAPTYRANIAYFVIGEVRGQQDTGSREGAKPAAHADDDEQGKPSPP